MKLSTGAIPGIDRVFEAAERDGRSVLYEYEVYQVLQQAGMDVPRFAFVKEASEVNEKLLQQFGQEIVVKIVSPDIAHKQKLGGVKIIQNHDWLFVQFILEKMKQEVLSHFDPNEKPAIRGFLIVEFIPHTQALGYEILVGFKEDPSFGPVIALSKGGDDAEFFARYYDPANLFLPHFSYEMAIALADTLSIKHKFNQMGHPEYLEHIARTASISSSLAYHYSFISEGTPSYIIREMEVNPFVVTKDGRFVAIDGFARFEKSTGHSKQVPLSNQKNLSSFFHPDGIAVIGVSADPGKYSMGREIALLMHDLGRKDLYCVNTKGGSTTIGNTDYRLYKNLEEIPANIDLAVYAAPAQYLADFLRSLGAKKPKAVILIPGIPSSIGYSEFTAMIRQTLPEGIRIIGPNCMGVFYAPGKEQEGVNTLFIDEKRLELKYSHHSNTALLTQSGGLAITIIDRLKDSRIFKSVVSFGNKFDVKVPDLMEYFAKQEEIDVITMYIEGFDRGEGRRFFELASSIHKPIIVYKAGRTDAGARAAASHTASMSGDYEVFKAVCRQAGIILCENIEDYYDYVKTFSLLARKHPAGNRVAGVVNAGFESTMAADELNYLQLAEFSPNTLSKLERINTHGLVDTTEPILDVTAMTDDIMFAQFVEAVLQDEGVDSVFIGMVPHVAMLKATPDTCRDVNSLANLLVGLSNKYSKPIVVSVNAGQYYRDFVSIMEEKGLPVYNDIRSAVRSLETFVMYPRRMNAGNGQTP